MILFRYLTKKISISLVSVTSILLLIALSNRFSVYLAKTASGQLPVDWIFTLVALNIPELLSLILPLCLMMSLLFAYGKLYSNSEFIVLLSSGVSPTFALKITVMIALLVSALVGYLTLYLNPISSEKREKVLAEAAGLAMLQSIIPGRFQGLDDGKTILYIEGLETHKQGQLRMDSVFIAELDDPNTQLSPDKDKATILVAEHAQEQKDEKDRRYLVLDKGYRYTGTPGTHDYTVIQFGEYGRELQKSSLDENQTLEQRSKPLSDLFHSTLPSDKAELGWRISLSLSAFILALLALPLSAVNPRQGRFAHFLPCILLFIVYYNFLIVAKRWVSTQVVNGWIGFGAVNVAFLIYVIFQLRHWMSGRRS